MGFIRLTFGTLIFSAWFTLFIAEPLYSYTPPVKTGIYGTILDSETGIPIYNVQVIITGKEIGTVTSLNGDFWVSLPSGLYSLELRMMGYKTKKVSLLVRKEDVTYLTERLTPIVLQLESVEAIGHQVKVPTSFELTSVDIRTLPSLGQSDVLQSIQVLPGISTRNEMDNRLYIRGGDSYQTQVRLDGIPVQIPFHLAGFISPFYAPALSTVEVKSSGEYVEDGGAVSAIVDIKTKKPSKDPRFFGEIGVLKAAGVVEGGTDRISMMGAFRRSHFDLIDTYVFPGQFPFYFVDGLIRIDINHSKNSLWTATMFASRDEGPLFNAEELIPLFWDVGGARLLRRTISLNKVRETSIAVATNRIYQNGSKKIDNKMSIVSGKFKNIKSINNNHHREWGLELRLNIFNYEWVIPGRYGRNSEPTMNNEFPIFLFFNNAPNRYKYRDQFLTAALYLKESKKIRQRTEIEYGARINSSPQNLKPTMETMGRISHPVTGKLILDLVLSQKVQYLVTAKEEWDFNYDPNGFLTYYEAWFPLTKKYDPLTVQQITTGLRYNSDNGRMAASVQGWLKRITNVTMPIDTIPNFIQGSGHAEGIDLLFRREGNRLSTLISYTLSRSVKNVGGEIYYPKWDRTHQINSLFRWFLDRRLSGTLHLIYASGVPYTPILARYGTGKSIIWGSRNSARLTPFFRMDAGIEFTFQVGRSIIKISVEVRNFSSNENELRRDLGLSGPGSPPSEMKKKNQLPIIPTMRISVQL